LLLSGGRVFIVVDATPQIDYASDASTAAMPLFSFDWSRGFVSPWHAEDGVSVYATPPSVVQVIVEALVEEAGKEPAPMVELGSGDGRICIAAARRGVRSLGIELDPSLVQAATRAATGLPFVRFECADALTAALPDGATVVSYLLPAALAKIVPGLAARGARRILSVRWQCDFADWRPLRTLRVVTGDGARWCVHEYAHCPGFEPLQPAAASACRPLRPAASGETPRLLRVTPAEATALASSCVDEDEEDEWLALDEDLFAAVSSHSSSHDPCVPGGYSICT